MKYKLGRLPVKHDPRTLKLEKYLHTNLVVPPSAAWGTKITNWGMMMNDTLGDCTCAGAGHLIMTWTSEASTLVTPTDDQIVAAYSAITGYTPSDPNSDQGANELDVLNYWSNNGIAGHKIGAYVSINPKNLNHVKLGIALFGGVYLGVNIADTDMNTVQQGNTNWSDTGGNLEGGHAIPLVAYDVNSFTAVTWGALQTMTPEWFLARCEEAYAIVSPDWVENTNLAPSGVNMEALVADLQAVKA